MKLVIDRNTWMRGEQEARLLAEDGRMCCLGFLALKCGFTEEQIKNVAAPSELEMNGVTTDNKQGAETWKKLSRKYKNEYVETAIGRKLMGVNDVAIEKKQDDEGNEIEVSYEDGKPFNEDLREKQIQKKMATIGVKVTFE